MKSPLFFFLVLPFYIQAQYCQPTQGSAAIAPVIDRVAIGSIDNANSGFGLTDIGYSDYTDMSTVLTVGETHTITIETGDFFPHNFGVWIDYDRDGEFSEEEIVDVVEIGSPNPNSKEIEFELPSFATNGMTRLRVRGMLEPFGPWSLSVDPCLPVDTDGEIEDYSVEIVGGLEGSVTMSKWLAPHSKIGIEEEIISVEIKNTGSITANNLKAVFNVNNSIVFSENIPGPIEPNSSFVFTFSEAYDFSGTSCKNVSVDLEWVLDENFSDNKLQKSICELRPLNGDKVWYLHSNINGGIEPLGGDPFFSTTNEVIMNTVFEENWQQEYFETADINQVFSDSSCLVFLDGSFDHNQPLEDLLESHQQAIENWVASGGKLFINCAIELSHNFYVSLGFDETYLTFYQVSHARLNAGHPLLEGPHQPLEADLTGFYYSNSVIVGNDLSIVVFETDDEWSFNAPVLHLPILAEKEWGDGKVLFGGLTPSQLVAPMETSMNLRANALAYLQECEFVSSVKQEATLNEIKIHPNPVSTFLHFKELESYHDHKYLKIYNTTGQVVLEKEIEANNSINVAELPAAYYIVELRMGDLVKTGKFVKN